MITKDQWQEIEALEQTCNELENIHLKLNWDMLRSRRPEQNEDFVAVRDKRIVGFLGLYIFGKKVEVCGMVHPDYRRQGIFTSLLMEALPPERTAHFTEILLNSPANSTSAKSFLNSISVTFAISEYQMTCSRARMDNLVAAPEGPASLRPAKPDDKRVLTQLDVLAFDYSQLAADQYYEATINEPSSVTYIIEYQGKTAGKVRLVYEGKVSWIYGFAIFPEFRSQGIGGHVLRLLISQETAEGKDLKLEVALNNPKAMKLYESVGFQITEVQDYYLYDLK